MLDTQEGELKNESILIAYLPSHSSSRSFSTLKKLKVKVYNLQSFITFWPYIATKGKNSLVQIGSVKLIKI